MCVCVPFVQLCMLLGDSHYVFIQGSNIVMCTLERKFAFFFFLYLSSSDVKREGEQLSKERCGQKGLVERSNSFTFMIYIST